MAFVAEGSEDGYGVHWDLFDTPPTQTGVTHEYVREYTPVGAVSADNVLEFNVPNNSLDYVMLNKTRLRMDLRILKADKKPIEATDSVAFVNLISAAAFRSLEISLQNCVVSSGVSNSYPYKALMDVLMHHGLADAKSWLAVAGFAKDDSAFMDSVTENTGWLARKKKTAAGATAQLVTKLFADVCDQPRPLLSGVPINVKLSPTSNEFRLAYGGDEKYQLELKNPTLLVTFAKAHESLYLKHRSLLEKGPAVYPFLRSDFRTFTVPANSYEFVGENVFQDRVPTRLMVAMVLASSAAGNPKTNPFKFENFTANFLSFEINGELRPGRAYQPRFSDGQFATSYAALFDAVPDSQKNLPDITETEFASGYALFVFDLNKSGEKDLLPKLNKGNTRLTVKFKTALPKPVSLICYGTFPAFFNVDAPGNVRLVA